MNMEKFTTRSQELIKSAVDLAIARRHQYVTPLYLLQAMLEAKDATVESLIEKAGGITPDVAQVIFGGPMMGSRTEQDSGGFGRRRANGDGTRFQRGAAGSGKNRRQGQRQICYRRAFAANAFDRCRQQGL